MASFIRTASSAAILCALLGTSVPAHAACDAAIAALEAAMQDGLGDLSRASGLLAEARDGAEACAFLESGEDALTKAAVHFETCGLRLEEALSACGDPDWSRLSASPELCTARLAEIDRTRAAIAEERRHACAD